MVQTAPAANCVPQVLDTGNWTLAEMAIEVSGKPPEFVSVTVCAAESWPSGVDGKESDVGLRMSVGGAIARAAEFYRLCAGAVGKSQQARGRAILRRREFQSNRQTEFAATLIVPQELLGRINGGVTETLPMGIATAPLLMAVTWSGGCGSHFHLAEGDRCWTEADDACGRVRSGQVDHQLAAVDIGMDGHFARSAGPWLAA